MHEPMFEIKGTDFYENPTPTLLKMVKAGPVVQLKWPIVGKIAAATTYEAVDTLLRDTDRFLRNGSTVGRRGVPGMRWWMPRIVRTLSKNMLAADGAEHRRLRTLVDQAFQRRNLDSMHQSIQRLVDRYLDDTLRQQGEKGSVDFLDSFAQGFPLAVICNLLGLPEEDQPKFTKWFSGFSRLNSVFDLARCFPGAMRLNNYIRQQVEQCRARPRVGLISELVGAQDGGERLTSDEMVAMIFLLLLAGHETTKHLLSGGLLTLLDHPEQQQLLMSDWSLADSAVDEMLRYVGVVMISKPRYVAINTELAGHPLEKGSLITAVLAAANVDASEFSRPESFDIGRKPNRHMTFGRGPHVCLGMQLARLEARLAFQGLFERFPRTTLAVPRHQVRFRARIGMRCLQALPVRLVE